jgi:asparagine synthase (glutamine-hydrolysing)
MLIKLKHRKKLTFFFDFEPKQCANNGQAPAYTVQLWGEIFNEPALLQKAARLASKKIAFLEEAIAILYAKYQTAFPGMLNGHFAVLILERGRNKLTIFSDCFNSIPVYFYLSQKDKVFIASSSIHQIANCKETDTSLHWPYFFTYPIATNQTTYHSTFASNISMLSNGAALQLDLNDFQLSISHYWSFRETYLNGRHSGLEKYTVPQLVEQFRTLFADAVKLRSPSTDNAVLLLSGGLDSNSLAMHLTQPPVTAMTACTFNSFLNGELARAAKVAGQMGYKHLVMPFSLEDAVMPEDWYKAIQKIQSAALNIDYFVKLQTVAAIKKRYPSVTLALTGYGSDQLLGGTTKFDHQNGSVHATWKSFFSNLAKYENEQEVFENSTPFYQYSSNFFRPGFAADIAKKQRKDHWLSYIERKKDAQILSFNQAETGIFLSHGMFGRFPFWDINLVTFILSVPSQYQKWLFFDKAILRKAMTGPLPATMTKAPKFSVPYPKRNEKIYQFLKPVIYGDNFYLLDKIFSTSAVFNENFNKTLLLQFLKHHQHAAYFDSYGFMLQLINIGLLDTMLSEKRAPIDDGFSYNGTMVEIQNWEVDQLAIEHLMAM